MVTTVKSRFLEPPRETKIGSRNRVVWEIEGSKNRDFTVFSSWKNSFSNPFDRKTRVLLHGTMINATWITTCFAFQTVTSCVKHGNG